MHILSSSHRIEINFSGCKNFQAQAYYVINQVFIVIKSYDYSSSFTMHSHSNLKINYSILFSATVKLSSSIFQDNHWRQKILEKKKLRELNF